MDVIINKEQQLSVSQHPITNLNRPPALNTNNSSNQSNGGYKKKDKVMHAQQEYDNLLDLKSHDDKTSDHKLKEFKM